MNAQTPHLKRLEAESIHIIREVAAECRNPVMLYSIGKDSTVMLHLAMKAFYPAKPPFSLLHVDTKWKFRDMITFREETVARLGVKLIAHTNEEARAQGVNPFEHGSYYTLAMKTLALKAALTAGGYDAAFGGARRDEEKSRAKERIFSFRTAAHEWDPKNQRPEFWHLYNGRTNKGESVRVFPLSNWTELDIWTYIMLENLPVVPLYFAAPRPTVMRDGTIIVVDDDRMQFLPGEKPEMKMVRFRSLGCWPLSGAIESEALTVSDIVAEMLATRVSERGGRLIDRDASDSMEKKKREGLFLMNATLEDFLTAQATLGELRFLTCGSVDDGKSTLIGRLLHEAGQILDDQLASLEKDSRRHGTTGEDIDFALLVDGLEAEREQGITIDVAYRFFTTDRRRFMVADTPGHEQYTRNMATGAANADLAVLLVDARNGLMTQTRRHAFVVSLMGIRHVVLAVNKIDLVGFSQARYEEIRSAFEAMVKELGFTSISAIPISARFGDNITAKSQRTPWYTGRTMLDYLETVDVSDAASRPFRMPVQWVNRPGHDFRGYAGTVATGAVRPGDRITVGSSGVTNTVKRIVTMDGDQPQAVAGDAITLVLAEEVDISRGDVLTDDQVITVSDRFDASLVWLSEAPLYPGRGYLIKLGSATVAATITRILHRIDVNAYEHVSADTLTMNDVAEATLNLGTPVAVEAYKSSHDLGGFILIDRLTNATVAVGMVTKVAAAAGGVIWQKQVVDKAARAALKSQHPATLWFTGLSGAGKSTIANLVEQKLHALGHHTAALDGDNVRHGLNRDLSFSEADRVENIRRAAEAAKLMVEAGLIVLVSFISPYRSDREAARELYEAGEFIEIFVDTPVDECRRRDPKGLYKRADAGQIANFTGVSAPYEAPIDPELRLDTTSASAELLADRVVENLRARGLIAG